MSYQRSSPQQAHLHLVLKCRLYYFYRRLSTINRWRNVAETPLNKILSGLSDFLALVHDNENMDGGVFLCQISQRTQRSKQWSAGSLRSQILGPII